MSISFVLFGAVCTPFFTFVSCELTTPVQSTFLVLEFNAVSSLWTFPQFGMLLLWFAFLTFIVALIARVCALFILI
jgi:hypothetical protein